ncbi:MAG: hypothetical protein NTZ07_04115 [Candidatus Woesebacteria bacterium]|nr:hypothetical protein [Candidatus Woesebacteria bacterium]
MENRISQEKILPLSDFGRKENMSFSTPAILAEGPFELSAVDIFSNNRTTFHTPELNKHIEDVWKKIEIKEGKKVFNGDIPLVLGVVIEDGKLEIFTGLTDFKTRAATSYPEYRIIEKFGQESVAITLGITCLLETTDGKLVLAQLGTKTTEKNKIGGLHCLGGFMEVRNGLPVNFVQNLKREIKEELGLTELETEDKINVDYCLGVVQDNNIYAVDMLFVCTTDLKPDELRAKSGDGEIIPLFINNSEKEITNILLTFSKTATTSALGGLYLYGKLKFGDEWAEKIRIRLGRRFGVYKQIDMDSDAARRMQIKMSNRLASFGK